MGMRPDEVAIAEPGKGVKSRKTSSCITRHATPSASARRSDPNALPLRELVKRARASIQRSFRAAPTVE